MIALMRPSLCGGVRYVLYPDLFDSHHRLTAILVTIACQWLGKNLSLCLALSALII